MLANLLFRLVTERGDLTVTDANGTTQRHGDGTGPAVAIKVHGYGTALRILMNPELAVGEAYVNGKLTVEQGSLYEFLQICIDNVENVGSHVFWRALQWTRNLLRYVTSFNPVKRARKNVAHHYDLSSELYALFLDRDRQYSCAYFDHPDQSLEEAQDNKKRHLAAKLLLDEPGLEILDIGSGWGGLGLYLAQVSPDSRVRGITLSTEQLTVSNVRARGLDLADRVRFELKDYRQDSQRYDRIVSVGMFEHVGAAQFRRFFGKVRELLKEDGVCVVHSIGTFDPPGSTNPWITKYIFPGGYIPSLSETLAAVEKEGLYVTDIEILRDHYAETLKNWRQRFYANRDKIRDLYDERFCRMWDFYLTSSELSFRLSTLMNFQLQLTRCKNGVPLQRDYMTDWERRHRPASANDGKRRGNRVHAAE